MGRIDRIIDAVLQVLAIGAFIAAIVMLLVVLPIVIWRAA